MDIVITGSAGRIGRTLVERLPGLGWTVRGFDRSPAPSTTVGDLDDPAALESVLTGAHAVVHLAGQPTEAPWPVIRAANIDGAVNLFEAARRVGVRRVVYASSNHAVGFTPLPDPDDASPAPLPATLPPRPDTLYGVSKVFGEALGRYYVERYGLQVACLRIGTFDDAPSDRRSLSTWLSPADCARLVDACLRTDRLGYAIVWGISANTRRTWDLGPGEELGYRPQDDAERFAPGLAESEPLPSDAYLGGGFTSPGFGIDEVTARWS